MPGSTFFVWNVSYLGVKPFQYYLDCCTFDPVSSVFQCIFLTCYAECTNCIISYWGYLLVHYFHAYFITACIWSASKRSIELTFQTRRFMVKLSVCTWGTRDWYFFCMIVFEMKKGSIHILCELFFYSVPVQRSSTLSQFLPSSITSLCSLYYVQFAFSQQSCWRLSWDAVLCFWARDTASHFRKLGSCYQFLILKFSIKSSSCFSVSTFLLCFSVDPQVLTVTFISLTHSTALSNYLQDTKI